VRASSRDASPVIIPGTCRSGHSTRQMMPRRWLEVQRRAQQIQKPSPST
jgi:hypothetical protein